MQKEWVGFHEIPGILLVRLMSRCNEKCLFCMVADEIEQSDDVDFQAAADKILAQPPGTQIEFFGGEPTIYPRFLDLLTLAREHGYYCSVATNLRVFHSRAFTDKVTALDPSRIYLRTSLYGDTAELHDYYTASPRSYQQTVQGIENIVTAGFLTQVNVVILKQNYERLGEMVRQVHAWGVPRIKFGSLIYLDTCLKHSVSLTDVQHPLGEAITLAESLGLSVSVEKTPACVIDGRLDLLSTERQVYSSNRVYDDEGACRGCLVRRWCDGLDPGYVRAFGFNGISRLHDVPRASVHPVPEEPELLKMCCVEIPDTTPDDLLAAELLALSERIAARHGELAVFPRAYVRSGR